SPFTDTINHQYEEQIAKAFEVGIIQGNGDGTFRPDHYITREEVASLVVNLVKAIDPYQDFSVEKKYAFSDSNQIASWAKDYISFCYQEKIMLGTGAGGSGAPTMNPKGLTTREEAILLLYRLAMSKQVYEERDYGTIQIRSTEENRLTEVTVSEKFGDTFGIEILEFIRKQIEENQVEVIGINDMQMDMLVGDSGTISLFSNDVQMTLQMLHQEQINSEIKNIFLDMVSIYEEPEQISDLLLRAENDLLSDNNLVYSLKEKSYLKAGMEVINDLNRYYFYYEGLN
ncbi:MAG: S-layer homology domain-containing protein, partial [Vallitaleaceae bacterium]|nr:S-layer homology domain-containing protein [Vallitaleaceae bacterium]